MRHRRVKDPRSFLKFQRKHRLLTERNNAYRMRHDTDVDEQETQRLMRNAMLKGSD